mgnify:FL=1
MNKKQMAGYAACDYIKDNMILGLGTGSTAYYMVERLGQLVKEGLHIKAVATSNATAELAKSLHIELLDINDISSIDLAIDGVDEIDANFNAIKGGGGALFREKIVANLAKEVIWIMDDSKLVDSIGAFPLPIEVVIYGYKHLISRFAEMNLNPVLRMKDGKPFITDNHNYIIDLHLKATLDLKTLNDLKTISGVVETGLFLNKCNRIIVGSDELKIIDNLNK